MRLTRKQCYLISCASAVLFLIINWFIYFSFSSIPSESHHANWADIENGLSEYHNKYYDPKEMYFMAVGWPILVEATEKLSLPYLNQAEKGWLQIDEHQKYITETTTNEALKNLVSTRKSIVESSYIFKNYWKECWSDLHSNDHKYSPHVSYFRLSADPVCSFLWMIKLRQVTIS